VQRSSFFNSTGYMVAALFCIATAAALGVEAIDVEIESNGLVGFILLGAGIVAGTYLFAAAVRAPLASVWAFVRRPRRSLPKLLEAEARERNR
jgi:hypothetical protein